MALECCAIVMKSAARPGDMRMLSSLLLCALNEQFWYFHNKLVPTAKAFLWKALTENYLDGKLKKFICFCYLMLLAWPFVDVASFLCVWH